MKTQTQAQICISDQAKIRISDQSQEQGFVETSPLRPLESKHDLHDAFKTAPVRSQSSASPHGIREPITCNRMSDHECVPEEEVCSNPIRPNLLETAPHVESIITQSTMMIKNEPSTDDLKKHQQSLKAAHLKSKMETIDASLPSDLLPLVNQARDKGASSWLNAMPVEK